MSGVPFPEMGVFFVSREPVRDPAPLAAFAQVRNLLEEALPGKGVPGSLSATSKGGFVIAHCPEGLGRAPETSLVEVYEYDPVRFQALVVGLVPPPRDVPLHWILRRTHPEAAVACVADASSFTESPLQPQAPPRGYLGNADTLLTYGKMLRGRAATLISGVGVVAAARTPAELVEGLAGTVADSRKATV